MLSINVHVGAVCWQDLVQITGLHHSVKPEVKHIHDTIPVSPSWAFYVCVDF